MVLCSGVWRMGEVATSSGSSERAKKAFMTDSVVALEARRRL